MPINIAAVIVFTVVGSIFAIYCWWCYSSNYKYKIKIPEIYEQLSNKIVWVSKDSSSLEGTYQGYKILISLFGVKGVYQGLNIRLYGIFPKQKFFMLEYPMFENKIEWAGNSLVYTMDGVDVYPKNSLPPVILRKLDLMILQAKELEQNGV